MEHWGNRLEVGGKGKIIGDWGLKQRWQVSGAGQRRFAVGGWRQREYNWGFRIANCEFERKRSDDSEERLEERCA